MKIAFILTCLVFYQVHLEGKTLYQYKLQWKNDQTVHVICAIKGNMKDTLVFNYGEPRFGGQQDILDCFTKFTLQSSGKFILEKTERKVTIISHKKSKVILEYDIIDTRKPSHALRGELFRPLFLKDYFYCHGVNLFLQPESIKDQYISIDWISSPDYTLFYGFAPGHDFRTKYIGPVENVFFNLITGSTDQVVKQINNEKTINYIVYKNKAGDVLSKDYVTDYFKKYYQHICEFWQDNNKEPFSLIIHPWIENYTNVSGVAFSNGFIGKYNKDSVSTVPFLFTISHEIGHHWLGQKLDLDITNQWFGEGFNDYITYFTLVASGLYRPEDFLKSFNEVLQKHYSSDLKNTPNDSVFGNYWKMGDYNKLPYRRGAIFAFYLDHQIRRESMNKYSIRDLLVGLKSIKSISASQNLTLEDFTTVASRFVKKESIESDLENYIFYGNPIPLHSDMLTNGFEIDYTGSIPVIHHPKPDLIATFFTF